MNYIPKIVYGLGPTTIQFTYPPEVDNGEQMTPSIETSTAIAGDLQVIYNHIEVTRPLTFSLLSPTEFLALQAFFKDWAALGNPFDYYESSNNAAYQTYTLDPSDGFSFTPVRQTYSGAKAGFLYQIQMTLRRAI